MRVLSLWQPWATLCVVPDPRFNPPRPPKQWETRSWTPKLPLPIEVAIHATKHVEMSVVGATPFRQVLRRCGVDVTTRVTELPRGAIIGVATIAEIRDAWHLADSWYEDGEDDLAEVADEFSDELAFGDYSRGRFAWRLANVRRLREPLPLRGRQEPLWVLPPDVEAEVRRRAA
jgi:hypothetical protein